MNKNIIILFMILILIVIGIAFTVNTTTTANHGGSNVHYRFNLIHHGLGIMLIMMEI